MGDFKKKLRAVWNKAAPIDAPNNDDGTRYCARALNGGPGWQVYDTREDRFLTNKEIKDIPIDRLIHEPRVTN